MALRSVATTRVACPAQAVPAVPSLRRAALYTRRISPCPSLYRFSTAMNLRVFRLREDHQVPRAVVSFGANVMNLFFRGEESPNLALHHKAMLHDVAARVGAGMIRAPHFSIPFDRADSTVPSRCPLFFATHLPTCQRAKARLTTGNAVRFGKKLFATLLTCSGNARLLRHRNSSFRCHALGCLRSAGASLCLNPSYRIGRA